MSDIVERLRSGDFFSEADCLEAAAEIEKLRAALRPFADMTKLFDEQHMAREECLMWVVIANLRAAAAALKETGE